MEDALQLQSRCELDHANVRGRYIWSDDLSHTFYTHLPTYPNSVAALLVSGAETKVGTDCGDVHIQAFSLCLAR